MIKAYRMAGLFRRLPIVYLQTHCDGSQMQKMTVAARAYARFLGAMLGGRIALVHVHGASNASFWRKSGLIALALVFRKPVIFHLHGGGFVEFYRRCGRLGRSWIRFILNHTARVVIVSDSWRAALAPITSARVVRIYNPLSDPALLDLIPEQSPDVRILFLGRITAAKGISELLEAFAQVRKRNPSVVLALAGDGDLEAARQSARALGVADAVEVHGWVGTEEKQALLQSSNVFVLPSYTEGLPMALLEAMAAGLAVVATGVGGIPDVIADGLSGLLIAPRSTAALAAALDKAVSDQQLRKNLGQEAKRRIRAQFMPDQIVTEIESLYKEVGGVVALAP